MYSDRFSKIGPQKTLFYLSIMDFSYLGFIYKENDKKREEKVLKNIYEHQLLLTLNFRIEVLIFEVFILKIHVTNIKTSLCLKTNHKLKDYTITM